MKFKPEKIDGGIRLTSKEGWVDLVLLEDARANLWCGTHNGAVAEVFGTTVWHLLHDVMPEMGLRAVAYDGEADPFVERILLAAGFSKDGTRRAWGEGGKDAVLYSILATEVAHEVTENGSGTLPAERREHDDQHDA